MRFTKSASSIAKINYLKDKPLLDLSLTNTYTSDDIDFKEQTLNHSLQNFKTSLISKSADLKILKKSASQSDLNGLILNENKDIVLKAEKVKYGSLPERPKQNNNSKTSYSSSSNTLKLGLPNIILNDSFQVKSLKEDFNLNDHKTEIESMGHSDKAKFSMHQIDPELKAYIKQKKNIREKIHDHWKLELNIQSMNKSNPLNKLNDNMFKSDQQWITINTGLNEEYSKNDEKNKINSLIDTFAADLDDEKQDFYKVNGEIGTLIAQKMLNGEKMRVCRNGELVNQNQNEQEHLNHGILSADEHKNGDIPIPSNSILSWKDQVNKNDIKILEPSVSEIKEEKKEKPERTLIVKKLVEEDAFKPKIRKSPLELKEFSSLQHQSQKANSPIMKQNEKKMNSDNLAKPVEIIGISRKATSIDLNSSKEEINNNNKNNNHKLFPVEPDLIYGVSLVPAKKSNIKPYENLTEKNYTDLIDNLTSRYSLKNETNDLVDSKKKNKKQVILNNLNEKRKHSPISLEFTNKFGLDFDLNSVSKQDKNMLKTLEKKYKTLIYHDKNTNNILNTQSLPSSVSNTPAVLLNTYQDLSPRIYQNKLKSDNQINNKNILNINKKINFDQEALNKLNDNINFKLQSFQNIDIYKNNYSSDKKILNNNLNGVKLVRSLSTKIIN